MAIVLQGCDSAIAIKDEIKTNRFIIEFIILKHYYFFLIEIEEKEKMNMIERRVFLIPMEIGEMFFSLFLGKM